MEAVVQRLWNEIRTVGFGDILDVLIIAYVIYLLLSAVRRTSAGSVMKGVVLLMAVLLLSSALHLNVINYLMGQLVQMGVIILVILFQPELRRLLEQAGSRRFTLLGSRKGAEGSLSELIDTVVAACVDMARTHTGALIVFERKLRLDDYAATGTYVNAAVTTELIKSIFFPNSPLHDGAALIQDGKIIAARCMLPMSSTPTLSSELGMRHKAGVGMSERCDAVSIIVSEETGEVSVAIDGMLKRRLDQETFRTLLRVELIGEKGKKKASGKSLRSKNGQRKG